MKDRECIGISIALPSVHIVECTVPVTLSRAKTLHAKLLIGEFALLFAPPLWAQTPSVQKPAPFTDFPSYVKWMQIHHKAPFDRDGAVIPPGGAKDLRETQAQKN